MRKENVGCRIRLDGTEMMNNSIYEDTGAGSQELVASDCKNMWTSGR